jgi:hypothetical protein
MAGKGIQPRKPGAGSSSAKAAGNKSPGGRTPGSKPARGQRKQQVIPEAVANRMARRIAVATGIPTVLGMGVFIGSYLLVSRQIVDIPPGATLTASGGCFLLGVIGLSYGVLSASWEEKPGSLLGSEQLGVNISRLRDSVRAMRAGGNGPGSDQ